MGATEQTSYGYISLDGRPLRSVISFTWQVVGNNTPQMTLLGENGVSEGTNQVKISMKHTVPIGQEEEDILLQAMIEKKTLKFMWAHGRIQMSASGKVGQASGSSEVNRPNTFDLDFDGFLDDYQADPVTP